MSGTSGSAVRSSSPLWFCFLIICAIKLSLYIVDPGVKIVLGDSGSYIATAVSGWVPPDRSYTYGLFLGLLLHIWHSLDFLVMVQVALSALAAMLLTWAIYRVLNMPALTAGLCGIACALEPLQLLSERYLLSEAISTCFFAVVVCLALNYLRAPRLRYLLLIAAVGTLLVSFRVYFLPALLVTSVFLPAASHLGAIAWREWKPYIRSTRFGRFRGDKDLIDVAFSARLVDGRLRFRWRSGAQLSWNPTAQVISRFLLHLLVAVVSLQIGLFALRAWYGHKIHGPAGYIEDDGFFLLADVSPIVRESDFRNHELGHLVYSNLRVPQDQKLSRLWNRWAPGGLVDVLTTEVKKLDPVGRPWEASKIAKRTAERALLRHPREAANLVIHNVLQYFSAGELRRALIVNEFVDMPIILSYHQLFFQNFGWNITYQGRSGLVREWHQRSAYWCLYLVICPAFATVALAIPHLPRKRYLLYGVLCAWPLWCISTFLPEEVAPRYFTGLAWLFILLTGLIVQGGIDLLRRKMEPLSGIEPETSSLPRDFNAE